MGWIYKSPKLAQLIGQALFSAGGFIVICGLIGRVAMTAINSTRSLAKLPSVGSLAEAYPMYSLWWVPEHFIGFALAVIVAALGVYLALSAKACRSVSRRASR